MPMTAFQSLLHSPTSLCEHCRHLLQKPEVVKGPFGDTPDLVLGWHDWWKEMYGTAFDHSHNLSISGGSGKINYY